MKATRGPLFLNGCAGRLRDFVHTMKFALLSLSLLAGLGAVALRGQTGAPPPVDAGNAGMRGDPGSAHESAITAQMQEQMADRRNSERQKQLVSDTEKLFQLASQLREEVAKSNKDQLSIPVIKKSEEIEKLAKAVKEKMRGY